MNRIETLIEAMTLPEKLGQMTMTAADYAVTGPVVAGDSTEAIRAGTLGNLLNLVGARQVHDAQRLAVEHSRLGIPLLIGLDIIHGHRMLFPIPLAETASFDPQLWAQTAQAAAREAAADGLALTFAPMLDVSREPRWGRSAEGPGEDPWLAMQVAHAKVRGFQGETLSQAHAIAACAKHYCGYGGVAAGREYASVDISERTLHEVHLPAFEAAVAAGVATVMPAFTDLAGIPMTAHVPLLQGWLRGRLGFDGVIISDYNAIAELMRHGVAADLCGAAALALNAGVDIDMMANAYGKGLPLALERGLVRMEQIDAAVRRVLTLKQRLGLFDDPYRRGATPLDEAVRADIRRLARNAATRSLVLLTNARQVLPLESGALRRLAVIGPLADAPAQMRGPWWAAGKPEDPVSVLAGLRAALPGCTLVHAAGTGIGDEADTLTESDMAAAIAACATADAVVLCLGEAATMSGEAASRADPGLPGRQRALAEAVCARARALGRPVVAVLFSGRPLLVPWLVEQADAVLAAWFPGTEAGHAVADVLLGHVSPGGRTPMTWPRALGQVPLFFGQRPGGRPADARDHFTSKYLDVPNEPLFAFGHGLTYGHFVLSDLQVTPRQVTADDTLTVSVEVLNDGARAAQETLFLFTHDRLASVARPLLELKGFGHIRLAPGERGTLRLSLPASELRFLDAQLQPVFEAGEVQILVGPSAERAGLLVDCIELLA